MTSNETKSKKPANSGTVKVTKFDIINRLLHRDAFSRQAEALSLANCGPFQKKLFDKKFDVGYRYNLLRYNAACVRSLHGIRFCDKPEIEITPNKYNDYKYN